MSIYVQFKIHQKLCTFSHCFLPLYFFSFTLFYIILKRFSIYNLNIDKFEYLGKNLSSSFQTMFFIFIINSSHFMNLNNTSIWICNHLQPFTKAKDCWSRIIGHTHIHKAKLSVSLSTLRILPQKKLYTIASQLVGRHSTFATLP